RDLAVFGAGTFGENIQQVALLEAVDGFFHGADVACALADGVGVEGAEDEGGEGSFEELGFGDEADGAGETAGEEERVDGALVIRHDEGRAAAGDVVEAGDFEVEEEGGEDSAEGLEGEP